jgi:hypothetical protein
MYASYLFVRHSVSHSHVAPSAVHTTMKTMSIMGLVTTLLAASVLLFRGKHYPKFIPMTWEVSEPIPTQKGLLWYSLYSAEVRANPHVVAYLDWMLVEGTDVMETPISLLAAYVHAVVPTGLVVLRSMSSTASEVDLFRRYIEDTVATPFCLITADGDNDMPASMLDASIAHHPMLRRWYSTNLVNPHPELVMYPIPIMLDLHTSLRGGLLNMPRYRTQHDKYQAMQRIPTKAASARVLAAVLGHMSMTHPSRADALELDGRPGIVTVRHIDTTVLWSDWFATHAFGISPRGNGVDCHRTWEMLFFHMIPIVQSSPLDTLYDGLPVVIVDSYDEVTVDNLEKWWRQHRDAVQNTSHLFDPAFWVDRSVCKIQSKSTPPRI